MALSGSKKVAFVLVLAALSTASTMAAEVPAGTQLADKQELVRNNGSEVASLDPHKVEGIPERNVINDLLEGLVASDSQGKVIPAVAESWDNQAFKVWTFHLRKEAKWSDGTPVTAADFVYSWQRLVTPATASPYSSYLEYAKIENVTDIISGKKRPETLGVKALDDHTLQVTLTEPVPYFYKMLFHTSVKPVNKTAIEKHGDKWTQPGNYVGNGAYVLKNWVVNERMVLERNPQYWDNAKTVINKVTFLPIASEVTDVNRYRSGEIEMTYNQLPIELFQKVRKELPREVHIDPYLCTYFYEFNNQKPPLDDVRVRTALKLALDRDIIVNKVKNQGDIPAFSFTPPYTEGLGEFKNPAWAGLTQAQRNTEAQKLLQEAGYSKEKPVELSLLYNTSDLHQKLAIAATSIWKKNLGGMANVKLVNQEWKTFLSSRNLGQHQIARAGWCADYNEPSSFLNTLKSGSSNNSSFYKNKAFDELMLKTLAVKTDDERAVIYQQAEQMIDNDSVMAPVYFYVSARLLKPYVGGFTGKNALDEFYTKDLYIIKH